KVLMSTCLSCPLASFFTFTLHAGSSRSAARLAPPATAPNAKNLFLRMLSASIGNLDWTLDAGAPLGNVRNAHGKMPANGNFPKQRLDRSCLRHRCVGKRTHVILNLREVRRKVRVPHGD